MMSGRHDILSAGWGRGCRRISTAVCGWGLLLATFALAGPPQLPAQQPAAPRCTRLLYYTRADSELGADAEKFLKQLVERRKGVRLERRDVGNPAMAKELKDIAKRLGVKPGLPSFYVYDQLLVGWEDAKKTGPEIEDMLRMQVFVRDGCPHCAACKQFLTQIGPRYPGLKIEYFKVVEDQAARGRMEALNAQHKITAPGLPTIAFCGQLIVGFLEPETTGKKITDLLDRATLPCTPAKPAAKADGKSASAQPRPNSTPSPLAGEGRVRGMPSTDLYRVNDQSSRNRNADGPLTPALSHKGRGSALVMQFALRSVEFTPMLLAFGTGDGPAAPPAAPPEPPPAAEEPDAALPAPPGDHGDEAALPPPPGPAGNAEPMADDGADDDDLQETTQVHKSASSSEEEAPDAIQVPMFGTL
ncbi:MAG TPA: glutaredoxin domain-containing protein, partial [Planctomycetaceae bacterium]|nr:glutaredoxin domain-containing protein [Planctomycetaceae bacterium]